MRAHGEEDVHYCKLVLSRGKEMRSLKVNLNTENEIDIVEKKGI